MHTAFISARFTVGWRCRYRWEKFKLILKNRVCSSTQALILLWIDIMCLFVSLMRAEVTEINLWVFLQYHVLSWEAMATRQMLKENLKSKGNCYHSAPNPLWGGEIGRKYEEQEVKQRWHQINELELPPSAKMADFPFEFAESVLIRSAKALWLSHSHQFAAGMKTTSEDS